MSRVVLACAFATLLPAAARGEPISISSPLTGTESISVISQSITGGFTSKGDVIAVPTMAEDPAAGTLFFGDQAASTGYTLSFNVGGLSGLTLSRLDPLGKGNQQVVRAGKSVKSASSAAALQRSATFAGGTASSMTDEMTHRGNILILLAFIGADQARVALELRNLLAGRGFQIRFLELVPDTAAVPEPASMLLLGTGLAGLAALRRRRRGTPPAAPAA